MDMKDMICMEIGNKDFVFVVGNIFGETPGGEMNLCGENYEDLL
jgi:hypothetical protein